MQLALLSIAVLGIAGVGLELRRLRREISGHAGKLHLQQVAIDGFRGDLGDIRRKQEEVLCEVTKYREDVKNLLADIRDLNQKELTDRQEILSRTNITGTSRLTNVRKWMQDLEGAAEKEMLGLGGSR